MQEEKRAVEIEFERLKTHVAGMNAKVQLLERAQEHSSTINEELSCRLSLAEEATNRSDCAESAAVAGIARLQNVHAEALLRMEAQVAYHEQSSSELEAQLARCQDLECNMSARAFEWQRRTAAFESELAAAERAAN